MKGLSTILSFAILAVTATACASANTSGSTAATTKTNPDLITTAEIDGTANARDAYDLIQRLRPTWFTKTRSGRVSISGSTASPYQSDQSLNQTAGGLAVYLDNSRIGDINALRDVTASSISTIRFLDAPTATATLQGLPQGVIAGAIVITSRVGH